MPRASRAQRFLVDPHGWMDDPAVQVMTLEERGAYACLWLAGWHQKEPGVYVADDRVLAQLARCTPEEWNRVRDRVRDAFVTERDRWILPRFAVTLAEQDKKRDGDRKRQARKRKKDRDVTRDAERDSPDGSGSGSGSSTKNPPVVLPEWLDRPLWETFRRYRLGLGKGRFSIAAEKLNLSALEKLHEDGHEPRAVIEQSIARGWTGLFPVRESTNGHVEKLEDWEVPK